MLWLGWGETSGKVIMLWSIFGYGHNKRSDLKLSN